MIRNSLVLCLFIISTCFTPYTVARDAIVGGEKAAENQFPYTVSVQLDDNHHVCGGGIIDDYHVLSAAHCFIMNSGLFHGRRVSILVGTNDLRKNSSTVVRATVSRIFVPTVYTAPNISSSGDIAVVELGLSLELTRNRHLKKLKLPRTKLEDYVGKTAWISGFGWTWIHVHRDQTVIGGQNDTNLRFVKTDILSNVQCQAEHSDSQYSEKHICARAKQRGAFGHHVGVCVDDSGGPLVHDDTVIGILSIGTKICSEVNRAAVYTRVSHYLTFIDNAKKNKLTKNMRVHRMYS